METSLYKLEVGADIAKNTICIFANNRVKSFANTAKGIEELITYVKGVDSSVRITCESTGSYGDLLVLACLRRNLPISICDARQIKCFIQSFGKRAKTDPIDAKFIAKFGEQRNPKIVTKDWVKIHKLKELQRRLEQIKDHRARLKASLDKYQSGLIEQEIKTDIRNQEKLIARYQGKIDAAIGKDQEMSKKREILESVMGIGKIISASLLINLPELGGCSRKEIGALVGLAPMNKDSGEINGKRSTKGGRKAPRKLLYMAALTAIRRDGHLRAYFKRLKDAGKPGKVAVIAAARKLLVYLNGLIKEEFLKT